MMSKHYAKRLSISTIIYAMVVDRREVCRTRRQYVETSHIVFQRGCSRKIASWAVENRVIRGRFKHLKLEVEPGCMNVVPVRFPLSVPSMIISVKHLTNVAAGCACLKSQSGWRSRVYGETGHTCGIQTCHRVPGRTQMSG